eukprot:5303334-Pleurochrysis_carterae.AAC.1
MDNEEGGGRLTSFLIWLASFARAGDQGEERQSWRGLAAGVYILYNNTRDGVISIGAGLCTH